MNKYYLVFYPANGNSEDCNVFYSDLVFAENEKIAIDKVRNVKHDGDINVQLEAQEMVPLLA